VRTHPAVPRHDPDFVTSSEAADRLGFTKQHIRRLIRSGRLSGEKIGRDWIVRRASIEAMLADRDNLAFEFRGPAPGSTPDAAAVGERERKIAEQGSTRLTVDEIMAGTEPSIELKRLAKEIAWSNGVVPRETLHRIHLGDARQMNEIAGEQVHLVVTSPPYFNLIEYEGEDGEAQLGHVAEYEVFLDELDKVWRRCYDLLVPGGRMCIVIGDVCISRREAKRHHVIPLHADISVRCREIGFDYLTPILWSKIANMATEVGGSARFLGKPYEPNAILKNDVEYILLLRKPGSYRKPTSAQRALSLIDPAEHRRWFRSVWTDVRGEARKAGHPAPFPAEIAYRLINMFSFVGDTVLDPFWGTGSTTVAAIRSTRSSIGYDIEASYLTIGRARLAQQLDATLTPARIEFPNIPPDARPQRS
jgi:site-specific DNA-methyltransferase (adenine-specific)